MIASRSTLGQGKRRQTGGRVAVTTTTHYGVVTLAHGKSLYLWDLDDDAPWHMASAGPAPEIGSVVRIVIENGRPTTVNPSTEANLTLHQRRTLRSVIPASTMLP